MTWIRRTPAVPEHVCVLPTRRVTHRVPAAWAAPGSRAAHVTEEVDGRLGDVWRCDGCGSFWTVTFSWPAHRRDYRPSGVRWTRAGWCLSRWYRHVERRHPRRPITPDSPITPT
jgi:hypothetical protein